MSQDSTNTPTPAPTGKNPDHPLPARSYVEVGDILTNLSSFFIAARDRRGLSIRAAAAELDVAPSTLSRLETGFYPSVQVAVQILEWLEEDCPACQADAHAGWRPPADDTEDWEAGAYIEPGIGGVANISTSGWPSGVEHVWLRVTSYAHENEGADIVLEPGEADEIAAVLRGAAQAVRRSVGPWEEQS